MTDVVHSSAVYGQHLCGDPARLAASWIKRRASDLRSRRSTSSRPRIKTKREPKQVLARYHLTSPPRDSSPRYTYRCAGIPKVAAREKPADLPVALPTKFDMVVNLKTAKSLGVAVPDRLLALADEVIE
jgi:hypothetical protein